MRRDEFTCISCNKPQRFDNLGKRNKDQTKENCNFCFKNKMESSKETYKVIVKTNTGKNCSVVLNARMSFTVKITKKIPKEKTVINASQT